MKSCRQPPPLVMALVSDGSLYGFNKKTSALGIRQRQGKGEKNRQNTVRSSAPNKDPPTRVGLGSGQVRVEGYFRLESGGVDCENVSLPSSGPPLVPTIDVEVDARDDGEGSRSRPAEKPKKSKKRGHCN